MRDRVKKDVLDIRKANNSDRPATCTVSGRQVGVSRDSFMGKEKTARDPRQVDRRPVKPGYAGRAARRGALGEGRKYLKNIKILS